MGKDKMSVTVIKISSLVLQIFNCPSISLGAPNLPAAISPRPVFITQFKHIPFSRIPISSGWIMNIMFQGHITLNHSTTQTMSTFRNP
jgi:hypothetical protein